MDPLPLSIVIVVLIVLSAFFSGTETAYSCANRIKLKSMVALGKKNAKAVYRFADQKYDKLVTAILVGNNIVNITASALATILFGQLVQDQNLAATLPSSSCSLARLRLNIWRAYTLKNSVSSSIRSCSFSIGF